MPRALAYSGICFSSNSVRIKPGSMMLNAGIANQEVDAYPLLGALGKRLIHQRFITHIHGDRHGRSACLADLSCCGLA